MEKPQGGRHPVRLVNVRHEPCSSVSDLGLGVSLLSQRTGTWVPTWRLREARPQRTDPQPPAASWRGVTQEPSTHVILNLPRERDSLRCGPLAFPMARLPNARRTEVAMEISVKASYPPRCLCILLPPPVPHCVIVPTSSACYFSLHCPFI